MDTQILEGGTEYMKQEEDSGQCCCGCSLDCAVATFGCLSICQFIMAILFLILAIMLGSAVASLD